MITLTLGCRTSALSMTQAALVIDILKRQRPDVRVRIEGISTHGDQNRDVPLQELEVIGAFTKEIDEAVLSGRIDFSVHSLKDVGMERPAGLVQAAVPLRANPRDVILFHPAVMDKIKAGEEIVVGTSSPRREELVPPFLEKALPQVGQKSDKIKIKTASIRGNVPTRVRKVKEGQVDAVVLAFAGVSRLHGQECFDHHLKGLKWMVMPLTECPGAPGQGAIYVETSADNTQAQDILASIHDEMLSAQIDRERHTLLENGGGCHQAFGVAAIGTTQAGDVLIIRGKNERGERISETRWQTTQGATQGKSWDGSQLREDIFQTEKISYDLPESEAVFLAHSQAIEPRLAGRRLFTSGTQSWFKCAKAGLWVEGCADSFGIEFLKSTLTDPVMGLPPLKSWAILTHQQAVHTWAEGLAVATYRLIKNIKPAVIDSLKEAHHIYWSSYSQFKALHTYANENAKQACGAGKTATLIGKNINVYPNVEIWRQWLKTS